jgi:hypothetical protein
MGSQLRFRRGDVVSLGRRPSLGPLRLMLADTPWPRGFGAALASVGTFSKAPEQFVASPLCLVGCVRWDSRSDRVPPLPDNHFQQLYRSHSDLPTVRPESIGREQVARLPVALSRSALKKRTPFVCAGAALPGACVGLAIALPVCHVLSSFLELVNPQD